MNLDAFALKGNITGLDRTQFEHILKGMDAFKDIQATELYCNRCKTAVRVREKLLLIIPGKNLYDYLCTRCGNSLGKREQPDADNMNIGVSKVSRTGR